MARDGARLEEDDFDEYPNLRLEVRPESLQERQEDGTREVERRRDGAPAVLEERAAEVLLDGANELGRGAEDGASVVEEHFEEL